MKPLLCYVAHPIGQEPERTANLERAYRWLRWLINRHSELAFVVPWLPYVEVLDESPINRARGIRDDLAVLRHCHAIVLVGGRMSAGMKDELAIAKLHSMSIMSYLDLGQEPPS